MFVGYFRNYKEKKGKALIKLIKVKNQPLSRTERQAPPTHAGVEKKGGAAFKLGFKAEF